MTKSSPSLGRRDRTRAALIRAAQVMLADGRTEVSVLEITRSAGVGNGSFYNHFQTKDELWTAAALAALDAQAGLIERHLQGTQDPAEMLVTGFRLTGRLHRRVPAISRVVLRSSLGLLDAETGPVAMGRRDLLDGAASGRFQITDPELALVAVVGAGVCLGELLHAQPDRDDAAATDQVAAGLLRMLGLPAEEIERLCSLPLPELDLSYLHDV